MRGMDTAVGESFGRGGVIGGLVLAVIFVKQRSWLRRRASALYPEGPRFNSCSCHGNRGVIKQVSVFTCEMLEGDTHEGALH